MFGTSKTEVKGRSEESYTADLCQFIMTRKAFLKIKHLKIQLCSFPSWTWNSKFTHILRTLDAHLVMEHELPHCVSHTVACHSLMSSVG